VEDCGADMISVHGRTKKGAYKAPVDYDAIKLIKESIKIPVIANGDITDYNKAQTVLEYTKANGVMIGRGAMGKPWIFYQIAMAQQDVSDKLKKKIILEHFDAMCEHYLEYGVVMFRKHLHMYSKGYQNANPFRQEINTIIDIDKMRNLIIDFF
jgi:tRNA-dihydrouridine synthase B